MQYFIEQRIHTLCDNAVMDQERDASFSTANICFSHWEFNVIDAWHHNYWLAESRVEALNYSKAWEEFSSNLRRVVPRIAFIGQCYVEYFKQPFLIRKTDSGMALFRHSRSTDPVGLMFQEKEVKALDSLLNNHNVPEEFYLYWNDAVNTIGYSSKLLLMFAALEALFKKERTKSIPTYYAKLESVLGKKLKKHLYGTRENPGDGLRQRLVHGEYLDKPDTSDNHMEKIHNCIINYFNTQILSGNLIDENVQSPQRSPFDNMEGWRGFIKSKGTETLDLMNVLPAFEKDFDNPEGYEFVPYIDLDALYRSY